MKNMFILTGCAVSLFFFTALCHAQDKSEPVISFSEKIEKQKKDSEKRIPKDKKEIMEESVRELIFSDMTQKSLNIYDKIPDFQLQSIDGETISSKQLLAEGYLVIVFYRGGWCPYCNIHLQALNTAYPRIKDLNANLVAISPHIYNNPVKNEGFQYNVLTDKNNLIAKKFGIVFQLNDELVQVYKDFGIDLNEYNGDAENKLPVPATYIVAPDGVIEYAYINPDYRERPDPEKIIEFLESVNETTN